MNTLPEEDGLSLERHAEILTREFVNTRREDPEKIRQAMLWVIGGHPIKESLSTSKTTGQPRFAQSALDSGTPTTRPRATLWRWLGWLLRS